MSEAKPKNWRGSFFQLPLTGEVAGVTESSDGKVTIGIYTEVDGEMQSKWYNLTPQTDDDGCTCNIQTIMRSGCQCGGK